MKSKGHRSPEERKITAIDISERLLPDLNMNEMLLWAPDLFAFTSYLMSLTGAYQLVVSPPKTKCWEPKNSEIKDWLGISIDADNEIKTDGLKENLKDWFKSFLRSSLKEDEFNKLNVESYQERLDIKSEDQKKLITNQDVESYKRKWGINSENWGKINTNKKNVWTLNSDTIEPVEEEKSLDVKIRAIANALSTDALKSLEEIDLKLDEIEKFKNPDEYEISDDGVTKKNSSVKYKIKEITYEGKTDKFIKLSELLKYDDESNWVQFVQALGDEWRKKLNKIGDTEFYIINDGELDKGKPIYYKNGDPRQWRDEELAKRYQGGESNYKLRDEDLLGILLNNTPPLLMACWAFFCNRIKKRPISDLLCNRDDLQMGNNCDELWKIAQSLLTMHAVADICCTKWGIYSVDTEEKKKEKKAQWFAERLLFDKGSLSTINPERGRVMPKRHNPSIGITLRSISSNIGFHRSSVEVVWRKTKNTFVENNVKKKGDTFSLLLFPFPLDIKAKDFKVDELAEERLSFDKKHYGFFSYEPSIDEDETEEKAKKKKFIENIVELIDEAGKELKTERYVDAIVFPEDSLSVEEYSKIEEKLNGHYINRKKKDADYTIPSLFIAGVRESRRDVYFNQNEKEKLQYEKLQEDLEYKKNQTVHGRVYIRSSEAQKAKYDKEMETLDHEIQEINKQIKEIEDKAETVNFSRNAVYCKFYNSKSDETIPYQPKNEPNTPKQTPKFKQYKHHRWRLEYSQITRYGLSQTFDENKLWWEAIKIPKRRVSFLNVGDKITISHLVCEDLARQDPIADLVRHVGPSLVVTLLMDGPQLKNRWSSRYASILSDDPGSSVIALTSWGMVKRHSSAFGLMSKVIALWSESDGKQLREIELADGAQAVLLNIKLDETKEKTADGRQEREATTVLRLIDVIQVYPKNKS